MRGRQYLALAFLAAAMAVVTAWAQSRYYNRRLLPGSLSSVKNDAGGSWDAPEFSLIDQDGESFTHRDLRGKVWVADFIFTGCAGACPVLSKRMSQLQHELDPAIHLVSFDVDPDHDTPMKLKEYARNYHADFTRWHFLATPSRASILAIARQMRVTRVQDSTDLQLLHSDVFLLIDAGGHVRGTYDSNHEPSLAQLRADADRLIGPRAVARD